MTDMCEDGNYLVRVRAQVMSRDDSSGGWVPLGGGGLSNVSVRRRPRVQQQPQQQQQQVQSGPETSRQTHEFFIYGMRISDECPVLACTIKKDFVYNIVMPTFHHWRTEDKKYGLTFQTAADARAFDKGVRSAMQELLTGFTDTCAQTESARRPGGDDDVFMTLNLPHEPRDSSNNRGSEHLPQRQYISQSTKDRPEVRQLAYETAKGSNGSGHEGAIGPERSESYSYVQLSSVHEYMYPIVPDEPKAPSSGSHSGRRDSASSLKKSLELVSTTQPSFQYRSGKSGAFSGGSQLAPSAAAAAAAAGQRIKIRCRYCQELYFEDQNRRGACDFAPDTVRSGINKLTCIGAAQCVNYHCASDAEGDFAQHPCDCSDENCGKRWICLTFLSLVMPCLWFYPPLKLCHWCGVKCGVCGGKHSMSTN